MESISAAEKIKVIVETVAAAPACESAARAGEILGLLLV
jgi:hypothetical protein